jgi:microcystin-dependent protein
MKSKLRLLSILMLLTIVTGYSQTSASTAGIAVQGIARDNNNTARINASISLSFEIYYLNNSNNAIAVYTDNVTLETDAFGVFSHVVDPGAANNAVIANNVTYLRISEGSTIISDEKFKHVPYAIAANNGVPTGSIMPFVGVTAPEGWVLCDGGSLTSVPGAAALIGLLGANNAPNLQGMFLRGTGVNPLNNQTGPALNTTQNDAFQDHSHSNNLSINNDGSHSHSINFILSTQGPVTTAAANAAVIYPRSSQAYDVNTRDSGNHSHGMSGSVGTANSGKRTTETRPVNYGVNYIIKL